MPLVGGCLWIGRLHRFLRALRVSHGLLRFRLLQRTFRWLLRAARFLESWSWVLVPLFLIYVLDPVLARGFLALYVGLLLLIFKGLLLLLRLLAFFLLPPGAEDLLAKFCRVLVDILHQLRRFGVIVLLEILLYWIETVVFDALPMAVRVCCGLLQLAAALILPLFADHSVWVVVLGTRLLHISFLLSQLSLLLLGVLLGGVNLIIYLLWCLWRLLLRLCLRFFILLSFLILLLLLILRRVGLFGIDHDVVLRRLVLLWRRSPFVWIRTLSLWLARLLLLDFAL